MRRIWIIVFVGTLLLAGCKLTSVSEKTHEEDKKSVNSEKAKKSAQNHKITPSKEFHVDGGADSPKELFIKSQRAFHEQDFGEIVKLHAPQDRFVIASRITILVGLQAVNKCGDKVEKLDELKTKYEIDNIKVLTANEQLFRETSAKFLQGVDLWAYIKELENFHKTCVKESESLFPKIMQGEIGEIILDEEGYEASGKVNGQEVIFIKVGHKWYLKFKFGKM